ncbi:response regulator transcription factor [Sphingomonas sp. ERG5]|uniref:response regulator transcription factor n=1 Tax=Sphingomonas sp. ERG5 TaxID=1381597 RepID=UPI00054B8793|nr:response regulator [Sphingomonas sp. ERG5]
MSEPERIVHVVDDDEAIRQSIGFMLRKAGFTVKNYPSGTDLLKVANRQLQGCVLLDVRMPGIDGLEVQQRLAQLGIALPVIMLTGHGDVSLAVRAIKAGAIEFLEKPFERTALLAAIEEAFRLADRGEQKQLSSADAVVRLAGLTAREREVLDGMVLGRPNKLIAYDLGIATRTVEVHRANLMAKVHANSLSDVLRIAFSAGLDERA